MMIIKENHEIQRILAKKSMAKNPIVKKIGKAGHLKPQMENTWSISYSLSPRNNWSTCIISFQLKNVN